MNILITMKVLEKRKSYFDALNHSVFWRTKNDISKEDVEKADIIIGNIDLKLLDYAKNLKYIHWEYAGSDGVSAHPLINNKVILTNSTGCYSLSIAEHILAMILYFYKNFDKYTKNQMKHEFKEMGESRSIYNSNILIIGCGSIGCTFAKKAYDLGAHVIGIKRTKADCPSYLDGLFTIDKLDEYLAKADIVVMAMPQSKKTYHIMNEERLAMLKDGSLLINVGRGSAIDTDALVSKLKEGKIQAALDVYEKEPLDANHPLWNFENCLMLPHITGQTNLSYTREKLRDLAIKNLEAYLNNKALENIVDFNTGYKKSNS